MWGACRNEMPCGLRSLLPLCPVPCWEFIIYLSFIIYQHIYHSQRTWSLVLSKFPISKPKTYMVSCQLCQQGGRIFASYPGAGLVTSPEEVSDLLPKSVNSTKHLERQLHWGKGQMYSLVIHRLDAKGLFCSSEPAAQLQLCGLLLISLLNIEHGLT